MASKKFNNSFAAVQQNFKLRQIDLPGTRAQTQEQKHARMENTGRGGGDLGTIVKVEESEEPWQFVRTKPLEQQEL